MGAHNESQQGFEAEGQSEGSIEVIGYPALHAGCPRVGRGVRGDELRLAIMPQEDLLRFRV